MPLECCAVTWSSVSQASLGFVDMLALAQHHRVAQHIHGCTSEASTYFFVNPKEELAACFLTQLVSHRSAVGCGARYGAFCRLPL